MMLAALFAGAADDPGGWSKARWGMTSAELSAAFGADAHRADDGRLVVDFALANVPFNACMNLDKGGLLEAIGFSPVEMSKETDALYLNLQDLLVQKYGRPWKSSEEMGITKLQWTFPTTLITLTRMKLPNTDLRIVSLSYKRLAPDSNPL
jgi:hypothetical protein